MTRVHEETWDLVDGERIVFDEKQPDTTTFLELVGDGIDSFTVANIARMQVAMCAPELVRALLAIEWGGAHLMAMCPQCQGLQRNGHFADCSLASLLRKAGVR